LVNERLSIYDCYDEQLWECSTKVSEHMRAREREIFQKVDIVFSVSQSMLISKDKWHGNVHYLPNAVEVEHFQLAARDETPIPQDMAGIPHPVIGFSGKISHRIGFTLIESLALNNPHWSVVIIGPEDMSDGSSTHGSYERFRGIGKLPNVYCLGSRPYSILPNYLKGFDVCIIPYNTSLRNLHCSPLKLYEYLSTGKPIVATALPELEQFSGIVRVAFDQASFETQVSKAVREAKDSKFVMERMNLAQKNSWDERAETALAIIDHTLKYSVREASF
jgi:glycosyltransferase involved in cell wall biosynthesis